MWHNCIDRPMKSEGHFWASMNHVHHAAVHHGYVERWQDGPLSSVIRFVEEFGKEKAAETWKSCPILDYGKDWDV